MALTLHKAEAVHGHAVDGLDPVPSATITIDAELPRDRNPREAAELHMRDARRLATVLLATLPGGTVDALMAELMTRRASQLRVPLERMQGGGLGD